MGAGRECFNCKVHETPMWRTGKSGEQLCNACAVYQTRHNAYRPLNGSVRRSAGSSSKSKEKRTSGATRKRNARSSVLQAAAKLNSPGAGKLNVTSGAKASTASDATVAAVAAAAASAVTAAAAAAPGSDPTALTVASLPTAAAAAAAAAVATSTASGSKPATSSTARSQSKSKAARLAKVAAAAAAAGGTVPVPRTPIRLHSGEHDSVLMASSSEMVSRELFGDTNSASGSSVSSNVSGVAVQPTWLRTQFRLPDLPEDDERLEALRNSANNLITDSPVPFKRPRLEGSMRNWLGDDLDERQWISHELTELLYKLEEDTVPPTETQVQAALQGMQTVSDGMVALQEHAEHCAEQWTSHAEDLTAQLNQAVFELKVYRDRLANTQAQLDAERVARKRIESELTRIREEGGSEASTDEQRRVLFDRIRALRGGASVVHAIEAAVDTASPMTVSPVPMR